jgi:hypothetical protein
MADSKTKRPKADDGVLASLPTTRPTRLSRRGRSSGDGEATATAQTPATTAASTATATTPKPTVLAAAKPRPTAKAAAAKPRPAATRTRRPKAVSPASPTLTESSLKAEENREPDAPRSQSGTQLVTTVVQAAGELAQIGVTVTGQILKRAAERLPRR